MPAATSSSPHPCAPLNLDCHALQLKLWVEEAAAAGDLRADGLVAALATAGPDGCPTVRYVSLKELTCGGPTFYGDYESLKARHLEANPRAELAIYLPHAGTGRQVRIAGYAAKLSDEQNDAYWARRSAAAQVAASASHQGVPVPSREVMFQSVHDVAHRCGHDEVMRSIETHVPRAFEGEASDDRGDVPRPSNWGGFVLRPNRLTFWERGSDRIHDRIEYILRDDWSDKLETCTSDPLPAAAWRVQRLQP